MKKGHNIGTAVEIEEVLEYDEQETITVRQVDNGQRGTTDKTSSTVEEMPDHLRDLFKRSKEHLTGDQSVQLAELLIRFKDTFSINDLDIGHFTKIKHRIDTGSSSPTKERMRRTPIGFEAEEEKHLK